LKQQDYEIFPRDIKRVGYEVRTSRRVKYYNEIWKINEQTFKVEIDEEGRRLRDEELTNVIKEFTNWARGQEKTLQDLFLN